MAAEVLNKITEDELIRERIIAIEKARQDQLTREYCAREQGIKEGMEKGVETSKQQIAKILIAKGMDKSEVKEITGLSDDDIESMIKN